MEKHLPSEHRAKHTWRYVGTLLAAAARGEDAAAEVEIALRLVLAMEGVRVPPAVGSRRFPSRGCCELNDPDYQM